MLIYYNVRKTRAGMVGKRLRDSQFLARQIACLRLCLTHTQLACLYMFTGRNLEFSGWRNTLLDARIAAVLEHEKGYYMIAQYEELALDRDWETRIT